MAHGLGMIDYHAQESVDGWELKFETEMSGAPGGIRTPDP